MVLLEETGTIKHRPLFNRQVVTDHYTKKDGVPVKYVCTTSLTNRGNMYDVYYRETPHPEFGNRYFGLGFNPNFNEKDIVICNADDVEKLTFSMMDINGELHYSRYVHDYTQVGNVAIDGGRDYCRIVGNDPPEIKTFVVRNGKFERTV